MAPFYIFLFLMMSIMIGGIAVLSLFKKWFLKSKENPTELRGEIQEESILSKDEVQKAGIEAEGTGNETDAVRYGKLSLHESWEKEMAQDQRYVLDFLQSSLSGLKKGQIALAGVNLIPHPEGLAVMGFIRNSLSRAICFKTISLLLYAADGTMVARQDFDLSEVGEIPAGSDRPWTFVFLKKHIMNTHAPMNKWKLAFDREAPEQVKQHKLDIDPSWDKQMNEKLEIKLLNFMDQLPAMKPGEFNISGVEVRALRNGDVSLLLLLRNNTRKSVKVSQLPILLEDAKENKVASAVFQLENITVEAGSCKPWRLIFPKNLVDKPSADFSTWNIKTAGMRVG